MKTNLPITNTERHLKADEPIVTETDLKGVITYANQSFVEISGFSEGELLGKSHNIVRHPEMPPAAFADLWETIKHGMPWRGLVKNRAKNGDFYWVEAYVSPIRKNNVVTGYRSVRIAPKRDEVQAAEALYQAVNQNRAAFPRTRGASLLQRIPFAQRAWLAFAGIAGSYLGLAALATFSLPSLWLWSAAALCILFTLAAGGWWVNAAQHGINKIQASIEQIEEGNFALDIKIAPSDEFANIITSVQTVAVHLRSVIADIHYSAQRLAQHSGNLDTVSSGLAQRTGSQSDRVMQVSAATEEMSVSVGEISHATEQMVESADEAQRVVATAEANMDESLASIQKIVTVVGNARAELESLRKGVEQIGSVTVTIKEIAEQTNLLALNAAIEAARAGESGRGFAVVADEVRKLAERTSHSTLDINRNITSIQQVTDDTVAVMEEAVREVERGTEAIRATSANLNDVTRAADQTNALADQMSSSLRQQSAASDDVAKAMEVMAASVEDSHHNAMEVADLAKRLADQARALRELVQHFEHR